MGSAIFAKEIRPVGDTALIFEAVREAAKRDPSEGPLAGGAPLPPRTLNDPCQGETGRQLREQTPNIAAAPNPVKGTGAGRSRSVKFSTNLASSILRYAELTRFDALFGGE